MNYEVIIDVSFDKRFLLRVVRRSEEEIANLSVICIKKKNQQSGGSVFEAISFLRKRG